MLRESSFRYGGELSPDGRRPVTRSRSHAARRDRTGSPVDIKAIIDLDDASLAVLPGIPGAPAGRRRSQRRELDHVNGSATLSHWRPRRCPSRPTSISDGNVSVDRTWSAEQDFVVHSRSNHRTFPKEFTDQIWYPGDEFGSTWQYRKMNARDNHYRNHSAGASPHYGVHEEIVTSADNLLANGGEHCWLAGYPRHCTSEMNVTWKDRRLPQVTPPPPTHLPHPQRSTGRPSVWEAVDVVEVDDSDSNEDHLRNAKRLHERCQPPCRCGFDHRGIKDIRNHIDHHDRHGTRDLRDRQQLGRQQVPPAPQGLSTIIGRTEEIVPFPSDLSHKNRQEVTFYPRRRGSNSTSSTSIFSLTSKHRLFIMVLLLLAAATGIGVPLAMRIQAGASLEERLEMAARLLRETPLIDGHNDLPWNIRQYVHNKLHNFRFGSDLRQVAPWGTSSWSHTDLPRLRKGHVAAQFWAAYVPCQAQFRDAVQLTLEQIDLIKRLTERYNPQLTWCTSTDHIREAHSLSQVCSLVGVEGGHSLGNSLAVLRMLYAVGVRYLTLTSTCNTPWADSAQVEEAGATPEHGGLTNFGRTVVKEMNRLGMLVDLSHVSVATMRDAMEVSRAPVFFSHSSARALCNSSRNVPDNILAQLANNRGLVMVNFYSHFLSCSEFSTVEDAVAHINHIRDVAGVDHVGLGAGFDGINSTPQGLEDVSSYPVLFAELIRSGRWSAEDLKKLAGQNFLRVMREVEKIRDVMSENNVGPFEDTIATKHLRGRNNCTSVLHFTRPRDQSRPSQDAP